MAKGAPAAIRSVVIVGGCGHVGLPLGIALADRGMDVTLQDISSVAVETVNDGRLPFHEEGAGPALARAQAAGRLRATTDPEVIRSTDAVIVVIGTPVDEHLNPHAHGVPDAVGTLVPYLRSGQLVVLRSTVYPGVTRMVERLLERHESMVDVAFCPERIAEGKAMTELYELPQIVGARTERASRRAREIFEHLTNDIVEMSPEEAELAKLFTNVWRYIKFATANQFYILANDFGVDFERVRKGLTHDYPRAVDMPKVGFAAGPCLFKDTMQLAAFSNNNFALGHAAMLVNEGLPLYIVSRLEKKYDLSTKTVGILGMAFKGESDDIRSSLSYKLKRILEFHAQAVLCSDPYVTVDPKLVPEEELLQRSDIVIIGAPHRHYGEIQIPGELVDIWGLAQESVLV